MNNDKLLAIETSLNGDILLKLNGEVAALLISCMIGMMPDE